MLCHVKELQFDARVSEPDPRFASILREQFGGADGELKDAANAVQWKSIMGGGKGMKEDFIHEAVMDPQFLVLTGGGPKLTDSQGTPWSGSYVTANGDPTVDLRSNIAAESRAKIVYEYLIQFTDDPDVKDTLGFLMTRELSHMNMFRAALDDMEEDFPPGVLKGDPRYTHKYFNLSNGQDVRGPWNEGQGPWGTGEEWEYIEDPVEQVASSKGQKHTEPKGESKSFKDVDNENQKMSKRKSEQIKKSMPKNGKTWSDYSKPSRGPVKSSIPEQKKSGGPSEERPS